MGINCCLKQKTAQIFMRFMFHKLTILFFAILGLVLLGFRIGIKNISELSDRIWFTYYQCVLYIFTISWLLFVLLLMNQNALCVVAKTFEFVLKLTLTLFAILMEYIWFFVVNKRRENSDNLVEELVIYISWLTLILMIIVFSSLDALYVQLWIKTFIGITLGIILVIHTLNTSQDDHDDILEIVGTSISLGSLAVSSYQFVLLFVVKQTVLSLLKKEKIISVKSSPYVKWVNDLKKQEDAY